MRGTSSTSSSTATWPRTSATGSGSPGTGVDTRPNRIYNPTAQLKKLDPEGAYVRRYVPELEDVPARDIAEPGLLAPSYPRPIVDHAQAVAAFRARRGVEVG